MLNLKDRMLVFLGGGDIFNTSPNQYIVAEWFGVPYYGETTVSTMCECVVGEGGNVVIIFVNIGSNQYAVFLLSGMLQLVKS